MAAATDGRKAGQEAAPSPVVTVAFEAAMQFGGALFGVPVTKMTLVTADGRHVTIDLPSPAVAKVSAVSTLGSECRQLADDILDVLTAAGPGVFVRGIDISTRISDDTDHTSGTWSRATKALKADGLIASGTAASGGYCLIVTG